MDIHGEEELIQQIGECMNSIVEALYLTNYPYRYVPGDISNMKDLSLLELKILRYIGNGQRTPLKDIRALVGIPNATLTSIIKRFEKRGLIIRLPNPDDRRSFILELTQLGKTIHNAHMAEHRLAAENFLKRIEKKEDAEAYIRVVNQATKRPLYSFDEI